MAVISASAAPRDRLLIVILAVTSILGLRSRNSTLLPPIDPGSPWPVTGLGNPTAWKATRGSDPFLQWTSEAKRVRLGPGSQLQRRSQFDLWTGSLSICTKVESR